jgi:hypothetical protein
MAHDVFISHSAKDKVTADAVCGMLESQGVRCWIAPRDVLPSMEWGRAIVEAIEESRIMVLVFTANANDSPQIRREVERAVNCGVAILPLRIEDVLPDKGLDYFIGNVHWLDALTPPFETHLKNLAGTIKIVLARMEPREAPPVQPAIAREAPVVAKPAEATTAPPAEPAFAPPPQPSAAKRSAPAPALHAEPVAVPPAEPRPERISPARATTEDAMIPAPAKVSPSADSDASGESNTRKISEQQPIFAAVPSAAPRKVPVWAWVGGAAAVLLIVVFAAVHFTSNSAPVASPEPVAPPAQAVAPNPASSTSPADAPVGPASVPKTSSAKTASPAAPEPSVSAKPAANAPETAPDNAALLRDTMSTLQEELSSIGTVNFIARGQNKANGGSFGYAYSMQVSDGVADPARCRVSYHWKAFNGNGTSGYDEDRSLPLREVTSVVGEPASFEMTRVEANAGVPKIIISTTPPVTVILVRGSDGASNVFPFTDAALTDRTAATLRQAVKLCGGTLAN